VLETLRGGWEGREPLQACGEVGNRLERG
jgi:hypothetical protein